MATLNSIEHTALEVATLYEKARCRAVTYVGGGWPPEFGDEVRTWTRGRHPGASWFTCDLVSRDHNGNLDRLIEVKGKRTRATSIPIVDRQHAAMLGLGADWWLYVVLDCETAPVLAVVRDPRRLPWRLLTPPNELREGRCLRGVRDEGRWHVMPSDVLAAAEVIDLKSLIGSTPPQI